MSGPDPSPPFLPRLLLLRPSARQALPLLAAAFAFSLLLTVASNGRQGFVEDSSLSPSSARHLARKRALGLPNCVNGQGRGRKEMSLEEEVENADTSARVFVSMAVCWSANTKLHHKATFPYRLATRLSVKLWRNKTDHIPLVQVVHSSPLNSNDTSPDSSELRAFVSVLESDGAVVRLVPSAGMDCALKSQLVRMLAFKDEVVRPNDFVAVADVDAFVVRGDIFDNLRTEEAKKKKVWLYQYENALRHEGTFAMSFVAMRAKTWRQVLGKSAGASAEALVGEHACQLNLHFRSQWDYDQLILSRAVLKSGLCRAPRKSRLWDAVRVDPDTLEDVSEERARDRAYARELRALEEQEERQKKNPPKKKEETKGKLLRNLVSEQIGKFLFNQDMSAGTASEEEEMDEAFSDMEKSSSCFYGFEWKDCNKGRPSVDGGCKWWHFYPNERERDLMKKYYEILN